MLPMLWCKPYDRATSDSAQICFNASTVLLQVVASRLELSCKSVAPSLKTKQHIYACGGFCREHLHKSVESLQLQELLFLNKQPPEQFCQSQLSGQVASSKRPCDLYIQGSVTFSLCTLAIVGRHRQPILYLMDFFYLFDVAQTNYF